MLKGIWSGLTNCEICIYDRNCGVACCKRQEDNSDTLITDDKEILSTANRCNHFDSFLTDKDIIQSPDPTSSVHILQVPEILPRFADHFEDDADGT